MADQKYLAVSDIQFPLHDSRALTLWMKVLKSFKPDLVDLAGSGDELFYGLDLKTAERSDVIKHAFSGIDAGGAEASRQFIADIRKTLPKSDIHLYDGNHGWTRHETYFKSKAPWILEEGWMTPNDIYGLDSSGVDFHRYDALPYNRFNDMYVHHGVAVSKHSGESVKADMDSWGVSIIRGHSHRVGDYHKTYELTGKTLEGYEIGHLMDVEKATYMNQRNWQQGFLYGYIADGQHHLTLVKIKDYTCWVNGKKFQA
jgi:hypothetical protein